MSSPEKNPAYGYVRFLDLSSEEIAKLEDQLHDYARERGLELRGIHRDRGRALSVGQLVALLQRGGIQHLIVPSVEHVSSHPIVQMVFCEAIYLDAGAELHEASAKVE